MSPKQVIRQHFCTSSLFCKSKYYFFNMGLGLWLPKIHISHISNTSLNVLLINYNALTCLKKTVVAPQQLHWLMYRGDVLPAVAPEIEFDLWPFAACRPPSHSCDFLSCLVNKAVKKNMSSLHSMCIKKWLLMRK